MFEFKNQKSKVEEYAPGHYNIICTEDEFANCIDHTELNKYHFFIEVMRPLGGILAFGIPRIITKNLTWANSVSEDVTTIPIRKVDFENNTIYVDKQFKEQIKVFKKAKFWQIEIARLNIFVITAPKKPKIIFL